MQAENQKNSNFLGKHFPAPSLRNESGIALFTALLFLVVLLSLSPMAIRLTVGETKRANDFKQNQQAFFVAEAGLEHAKYLIEQTSIEEALFGPDDLATTTPSDAENDDNGTFGAGTPVTRPDGNVYDEVNFKGNTYYIRAWDNEDGDSDPTTDVDSLIMLSAVGVVDGNTTTVEATVYTPPGPSTAIAINGDLDLPANATISGACGNVHGNGDITISGNPAISQDVTASGAYTESGNPTIGGVSGGGYDNAPIPLLDPTEFEQYADYKLASDGSVYDANGGFVSNSPWNGWTYTSPKWSLSGSLPADVSLYVEGDVEISNNPTGPWAVTIVATGYIDVSGGNGEIINKKNPADPKEIQNIFMLAGTDIKYKGNNSHTIEGLFYAREQIAMSGDTLIEGAIMTYNDSASSSLVTTSKISNDPIINYNCGMAVPGVVPSQVKVVSWHQVD